MNLNAHEQDKLNKLSALMEEREKESAATLMGEEAAETCPLVPTCTPSEEGDKLVGEPKNEKEAALPSPIIVCSFWMEIIPYSRQ